MSNKRYQGKVVRWKGDRGFGFLQTNGIKKDIFLHISSMPGTSRRPQTGDTVYFDLKREADGKYKAVNASFTKLAPVSTNKAVSRKQVSRRNTQSSKKRKSYQLSKQSSFSYSTIALKFRDAVLTGLLLVGAGLTVSRFLQSQSRPTVTSNPTSSSPSTPANRPEQSRRQATPQPTQNCDIKGNISFPDGEKFYHKPGYRDYREVEIFTNEGERWFCSEAEAIEAGWKDAANH